MPMVEASSGETLLVSQSRTTIGTRRPSVFGANIYNQHLGFSSDGEETDTLLSQSQQMVKKSEVQGAVNGPVSQFSNFQRFKHHVQDTDYYSARCSATMSSSDCTERRQQQQQQLPQCPGRKTDSVLYERHIMLLVEMSVVN